eukprot:scaffold1311_cov256-Pinguiococcus_pyrenoidosus.AAC.51
MSALCALFKGGARKPPVIFPRFSDSSARKRLGIRPADWTSGRARSGGHVVQLASVRTRCATHSRQGVDKALGNLRLADSVQCRGLQR